VAKKPSNPPFNNPFGKLKELAKKPASRPEAKPLPPPRAADVKPHARPEPAAGAEADLWASAVDGVTRLDPGPGLAAHRTPAGPQPFHHPDLDALEELRALVHGELPFDISDTDEFIEGSVSGLDHGIVRRLRRGEWAVQGHVDLHGMTRDEAKSAVERFLRESRNAGKRCVLLVHGRGLHSKDQVPVLKEALKTWLVTARFGKHVLAFATARPQDGGGGAIYVLLRKLGR
jgi:DNA-nicking Smr family endonuclease